MREIDYMDDGEEYDEDDSHVNEEDEWECAYGVNCVCPHVIHRRSECMTAEMVQEYYNSLEGIF